MELRELDDYEDEEYKRIQVQVEIVEDDASGDHHSSSSGRRKNADAYVYCWDADVSALTGTWQYEIDFEPIEEQYLQINCPP